MTLLKSIDFQSELVLALATPIGVDKLLVRDYLRSALVAYGYELRHVRVTDIIQDVLGERVEEADEEARIQKLIDMGNRLRRESRDPAILAALAISAISDGRTEQEEEELRKSGRRTAILIDSLKCPGEVDLLRRVYGDAFFLVALHVDESDQVAFLTKGGGCSESRARKLVAIARKEESDEGQKLEKTFHLADFFFHFRDDGLGLHPDFKRMLRLLFGSPADPPTRGEYAMHCAFSSAMRSSDLSRQVGAAVVVRGEVVALGCNEVPKAGGGPYMSRYSVDLRDVVVEEEGRDFVSGGDANHRIRDELARDISDRVLSAIGDVEKAKVDELRDSIRMAVGSSGVSDLTEYGRAVHAEMDALMSCLRSGVSARGGDLYVTTFPCHNCAKHIVAAGVRRVFYIEPYPKSRAFDLHGDALTREPLRSSEGRVSVRPFAGVAPRAFMRCFAMELPGGTRLVRKGDRGAASDWDAASAVPRKPLVGRSYLEVEVEVADCASRALTDGGILPDGE